MIYKQMFLYLSVEAEAPEARAIRVMRLLASSINPIL